MIECTIPWLRICGCPIKNQKGRVFGPTFLTENKR
jgi:hypothetical protein